MLLKVRLAGIALRELRIYRYAVSGVSESPAPFEHDTTAKLFMHGGSQAVRLPKAFRFEGSEVAIRKEGEAVILQPLRRPAVPRTPEEWDAFWAEIDRLRGDEIIPYPPRDDVRFGPDAE